MDGACETMIFGPNSAPSRSAVGAMDPNSTLVRKWKQQRQLAERSSAFDVVSIKKKGKKIEK